MANACMARQLAPFNWCRLLVPFGQIPRVSDPGRLFVPVLGGLESCFSKKMERNSSEKKLREGGNYLERMKHSSGDSVVLRGFAQNVCSGMTGNDESFFQISTQLNPNFHQHLALIL